MRFSTESRRSSPRRRHRRCNRRANAAGQATVEFALIIPLVVAALLTVLQISLLVYAQLSVTFAAHEAARAVSVDRSVRVVDLQTAQGPELSVELVSGDQMRVLARRDIEPISPLFAPFLDGLSLEATALVYLE